ncbi:hypothetical protein NCS52_01361100 [Fusarium sp. LHS14.1]|nr:hypothetical protein NCS52_01361100 [Fusarium sp. LHS14.1]
MCSVCPGCKRVQSDTAAVRSAIAYISYSLVVEGHELENIWFRMNHLEQAMKRVEERFGGDKTPPEPGSPKDNVMLVINVALDTLTYILSALDEYGSWPQADTQHHFSVVRHQLDNILGIIAGIIKATAPLLEAEGPLLGAEDCHEGMELPDDPSSSPRSSQAGEGVGEESHDEAWTFRMQRLF